MELINSPGATADHEFTEGNPSSGVPATVVSASWLNSQQREMKNALLEAGLTPDANDPTQLRQAIAILAARQSGSSGSKNLIINGTMEVQQRARAVPTFTLSSTDSYTLDRWVARCDGPGSGAGAGTVSRQNATLGDPLLPQGIRRFLRFTQTGAATVGPPTLAQRVEDVARFGEGNVCFSIYAKANAALQATLKLTQYFGNTGGGASAAVVIGSQSISLSNAFQRFHVAVDVTGGGFNMTGKVLGIDVAGFDNHYLACEILLPQATTFTADVTAAQLERSSTPTGFDFRSAGQELELARRYHQRSGDLSIALDAVSTLPYKGAVQGAMTSLGALRAYSAQRTLQPIMRSTPTGRWWNPLTGVIDTVEWDGTRGAPALAAASQLSSGFPVMTTEPASGTTKLFVGNYEISCEL